MEQFDCAYCGEKQNLPFQCNYCNDKFCAEHRLPEDHRCVKLHQIRTRRFGENKVQRRKGIGRQGFIKRVFGKFGQ
ncbi:MAG: AN1-type zinc finger domain-containing protein [Nitrosotalea sp.]